MRVTIRQGIAALAAGGLGIAATLALADPLASAIEREAFREITSVVVAEDGEITYERYFGETSATRLHDTRSATKTLVAMAVGAAIADGKLDGVDAPVWPMFTDEAPYRFDSAAKRAITVRDLLTMSSALDCNDNVWETPGNEEHMYPARRWLFFVLDLPTETDYARDARGFGPFRYCTAGSFLLGQVVERAVGERVDRYIERRLLTPLGAGSVSWPNSPSGEIQTGGGTRLTSRALLAVGELLRNGGRHGTDRLLPAAWVDEMLTPHVRANERQQYGYQIWHETFACGDGTVSGWYLSGNGGNKIVVVDELDVTAVITATLYGTRGMHEQTAQLFEQYVLAPLPACSTAGR